LNDILVKRNKASQKDEDNNAKELVKSSIKEITDWIKSDNSVEVQVSRAEKIMAFITKS
jgi:glutamyl-tRNA reductase